MPLCERPAKTLYKTYVHYLVLHNDILYNRSKTVCMSLFPKGRSMLNTPKLFLGDTPLSFVNQYKYLGMVMLNAGIDDLDMARQMRSFYVRCNFIISNFACCSHEVKLKLFSTFCTNMYCSHLWQ